MANNLIQIKRSTTTAVNGSTPTLANGELAFTANGNGLWIGLPDGSANMRVGGQMVPGTLTANQALVANATSGIDKVIVANLVPTGIYANGATGTGGQVLKSGGAGGNVYWDTVSTGVAGTNTQIQFNDSGTLAGDANLTFNKTTSTLSATKFSGNGAGITSVDAATVGGNTASTLRSYSDTTAATAYSNATGYADTKAATAYSNATSYADTKAATAYSNATSYAASIAATAYSNAVSTAASDASTKAATAYSNATSYADSKAATAYSNATSYAASIAATAYSNATSYADTKAGTAYSNAMADTLSRNGTYTGNNIFAGDVTVQGNTVLGNNLGLDVVTFVSTVNSNIMPSANVTYSLGNNTIRWNELHASNVHSVTGYFDGSVQIGGDLIVTGNVTTTNVNSVVVSDPMIYLAGNNYTSDLVDIGFAGNYYDGATQRHTGFVRHASTDQYYLFKNLTQELSGNNVVDINDPSFRLSQLNAFLVSGGLLTNSTAVSITANSTVNVAIVANTLTLSTALPANSGGTGQSSFTAGDLLYASNTSYLSKLAVPGSAANGQVLQIVNNLPAYGTLDGGTF